MRALSPWVVVSLALATFVAAGCISDEAGSLPPLGAGDLMEITVQDATGAPVPFFHIAFLDATGLPLLHTNTRLDGTLAPTLPEGATHLAWQDGNDTVTGNIAPPLRIILRHQVPALADATLNKDPLQGLRTHKIIDLGSKAYLYSSYAANCRDVNRPQLSPTHDCGLSEPTIEVAGDGVIYVSGVCCIGGAPPIWVSRNDGQHFELLGTPFGQREAFGIEGDFAIDDVGNMYFFDIELGAVQVSQWTAQGTHQHTTHWPGVPLVDRPWIRAEGDGILYLVYNRGPASTMLKSTDHGRTYGIVGDFPYGLANVGRGHEEGSFIVAADGSDGKIAVYETTDGAASWKEHLVPAHETIRTYVVPLVDDAGNRYLVYDALVRENESGFLDEEQLRVFVITAPPGGDWSAPVAVSPPMGTHAYAWGATSDAGKLALAWYGTLDDNGTDASVAEDAAWYLFLAVTLDALAPEPTFQTIIADPQPVLKGPVMRRLLDFLQVDIGPDGAIHVGYAHIPPGAPSVITAQAGTKGQVETTVYLQTLANLPLVGPDGVRNGPH